MSGATECRSHRCPTYRSLTLLAHCSCAKFLADTLPPELASLRNTSSPTFFPFSVRIALRRLSPRQTGPLPFTTSVMNSFLIAAITVAAVSTIGGCGGDEPSAPTTIPADTITSPTATFKLMQTELFAKSCAISGCHAGDAPTGGLSLEPAVAWKNLVGVAPENVAAATEGLQRVMPGQPERSFLLMKLRGQLGANHGAQMPLGSATLDSGKLEFIRQWIAAGAPDTGAVANPQLLLGSTDIFTQLQPPASGFQLHLTPFDIPANRDREIFVTQHSPAASDLFVTGYDVKMRNNSHHFILYTYPKGATSYPAIGKVRELGKDMDEFFSKRVFFLGSQTANDSYRFPQGVALQLPGNTVFDLNSHYVNPNGTVAQGEVYVNLHTTTTPQRIAQVLFASQTNIYLPPYQTTVVKDSIQSPVNADIFMLTSHTHKQGQEFRIYIRRLNGKEELVYQSSDWHLPVVKTFATPLRIWKGEWLRWEATYRNDTDAIIRYGNTSQDEMCIITGYFAMAQ